jgi:hypothetical protein
MRHALSMKGLLTTVSECKINRRKWDWEHYGSYCSILNKTGQMYTRLAGDWDWSFSSWSWAFGLEPFDDLDLSPFVHLLRFQCLSGPSSIILRVYCHTGK